LKNLRDKLKILVYLASEVLILLGIFFIISKTSGPVIFPMVLAFSLLAPSLLILTRVKMLGKPVGTESGRKTDIEALCEHLRQIGLNATVESKQPSRFRTKMFVAIVIYGLIFIILFFGFFFASLLPELNWAVVIRDPMGSVSILGLLFGFFFILPVLWLVFFPPQPSSPDSYVNYPLNYPFMGSVRVANRNIDLIELQWRKVSAGRDAYTSLQERRYRCNYVVQAKVEGLEDKLKAEFKPVTKGFLKKEVVDFRWMGGELAQALNKDAKYREALHHMMQDIKDMYKILDGSKVFLFYFKIKPDRKHECVRITQEGGYVSPESAFPTVETFEVFDRIAHLIRSIASVRR